MLLSSYVSVNITPRNRKFYENKGYNVSFGQSIEVSIEDLPKSSGNLITVKCDYCNEMYNIRFCDYMRTKHVEVKKDACKNCWYKKRQDIFQYKLDNNLIIADNQKGYWSDILNIKNELKNYIERNGRVGKGVNKDQDPKWNMIYWALRRSNLNLDTCIIELGFNPKDVIKKMPNGYVVPFEDIKENINMFISKYGFFPNQINLVNEFNLHSNNYLPHGTLDEIKEKLGYGNKKYLIDNRGFINKSTYELIVANYLIAQNIPYKREQYPFRKYNNNLNYKSDFTFYLPNNEIHVEVWGGMKTFKGQRELYDYDKIMKEKMRVYNLYGIQLISITPELFYNSMDTIKHKLYKIFSPYLNLPFLVVKDRLVSTFKLHHMSDEDLLKEIMKFSKYEGVLPSTNHLRIERHEFLYTEVLKRFGSYRKFADQYNLKLAYDFKNKTLTSHN